MTWGASPGGALWLHWAEGGAEKEVAIEGALLRHGDVQRVYE